MNHLAQDLAALPPPLRKLLDAELAAGNEILEVGHSFPAAPCGAYVLLRDPVQTEHGDLRYRVRNSPLYSGEFTDEQGYFFLLEAPRPELPPQPAVSAPPTLLDKFQASMVLNYDKWHDGESYDLALLPQMNSTERAAAEKILLSKLSANPDWRDVEALHAIDSPAARVAVQAARQNRNADVRNFTLQLTQQQQPLSETEVIQAIQSAAALDGLAGVIDLASQYNTPAVRSAALERARSGDAPTRVHMAALLYYFCGLSAETFDWKQRPIFLQFAEPDSQAAWNQLSSKLKDFEEISKP
ncbi:hypothetical protein [Bryobacter aggregatus]|uniref:hypothetical protein n=1 Tax=Bryobacter aggregatus TaxID=360054 RepID=UPI0004E260FD|nr:hypothetical protein [Bryobacter aggregatus]